MNINLPPPPIQNSVGDFVWQEWFRQIRDIVSTLSAIVLSNASSITGSGELSTTSYTNLVNTSGVTLTLPKANAVLTGRTWTIIMGVNGYCDISTQGGDTFTIPTTDTTMRLTNKGSSVSLRCLSTNSWGIV